MSAQAKGSKPTYERPTLVPLGALAEAQGRCSDGSTANRPYYCSTGSTAGYRCSGGSSFSSMPLNCSPGTVASDSGFPDCAQGGTD